MSKSNMTAAFAALLIATAPVAYAQMSPTPHSSASAMAGGIGTEIQPDQFRASKMIGSAVYDVQNRDVGKVEDLVVNKDGTVAAAVVDVGEFLGMGGKYVAVPLSNIKTDNNRLTLDMSKEQLKEAQAYRLESPITGSGSSTSPVTGGHLGSASGSSMPPRQ